MIKAPATTPRRFSERASLGGTYAPHIPVQAAVTDAVAHQITRPWLEWAHGVDGELQKLGEAIGDGGDELPLHAPTHAAGGTDPVSVTTLAGYTGDTAKYLRADGTFATPPGGVSADEVFIGPSDPGPSYELWYDSDAPGAGGDVQGPGVSVVDDIATYADTTGKTIKDSGVPIAQVARRDRDNQFALDQTLNKTNPGVNFYDTAVAANSRRFRFWANAGALSIDALTDDASGFLSRPLSLDRAGNAFIGARLISPVVQTTALQVGHGTVSAQPTGLGPNDHGRLYFVDAPYGHLCIWNGSFWEFAPGDGGNGYFSARAFAPQETGWQECNGTPTDYLVVGGATIAVAAFTTPNLLGGYYLKYGAAYDPTPVAASMASAGGHSHGGGTDAQGAHGHSLSINGVGAHSHGGSTDAVGDHQHSSPSHTFYGIDPGDQHPSFLQSPTNGAGGHSHGLTTDAQGAHTHTGSADGVGAHSHALATTTAGDHVHAANEPAHITVRVYFRR